MMTLHNWHSGNYLAAGAIAIVIFCLGVMVDRQAFFACWLVAWWTCAGAVLGSQANLWLHDLSGGAWGEPLRPIWRRLTAAMPMLLALMIPLAAAAWMFYPWSDTAWAPSSRHPDFQALWLSPAFVTLRLAIYAAIWQTLSLMSTAREDHAQHQHPRPGKRRKGMSALGLIAYGFTISLAGIDLIMSLIPQWYSSGFGLIAITMQMKLGFALGVAGAAAPGLWRQPLSHNEDSIASHEATAVATEFPAQLGRDWGNLLLMYVMMWAYIAFVQFLIIWAENLPNEIAWYVPRMQTNWIWLGVVLAIAGFFAPLLLLLLRSVKQNCLLLRAVAIALCVLGWLEAIWVALPSVPGLTWHTLWMAPLALTGMTALLCSMAMPGRRKWPICGKPAAIRQLENKP